MINLQMSEIHSHTHTHTHTFIHTHTHTHTSTHRHTIQIMHLTEMSAVFALSSLK